jgi:hypothetical protein
MSMSRASASRISRRIARWRRGCFSSSRLLSLETRSIQPLPVGTPETSVSCRPSNCRRTTLLIERSKHDRYAIRLRPCAVHHSRGRRVRRPLRIHSVQRPGTVSPGKGDHGDQASSDWRRKAAEIWVQTHQEPRGKPLTLERESFQDPGGAIAFVNDYRPGSKPRTGKAPTQSEGE